MSDLTLTILIMILSTILIVVVFLIIRAQKQKIESELENYCKRNGFTYERIENGKKIEILIQGDYFNLNSKLIVLNDNEESSSSSHEEDTLYTINVENYKRPIFVMGNLSLPKKWDNSPSFVKDVAIMQIKIKIGMDFDISKSREITIARDLNFLLFEEEQGDANSIITRIKPYISNWPPKSILFISSNTAEIKIYTDSFIKNTELLDRIIQIGKVLKEG